MCAVEQTRCLAGAQVCAGGSGVSDLVAVLAVRRRYSPPIAFTGRMPDRGQREDMLVAPTLRGWRLRSVTNSGGAHSRLYARLRRFDVPLSMRGSEVSAMRADELS